MENDKASDMNESRDQESVIRPVGRKVRYIPRELLPADWNPPALSPKDKHWLDISHRLYEVTDRLGRPIDDDIFSTVVMLNVFNINTFGSCEGHIDHGTAAPWIMIEDPASTRRELVDMVAKGEKSENFEELAKLVKEANLRERMKLNDLLQEFYQQDINVFDDRRLIIRTLNMGIGSFESVGAELQASRPLDLRIQKLTEYRDEMDQFCLFLRRKYYSS